VILNAICLHEEDTGILWKHYDFRTDETDTRRGRRLVVSFIATVGNYEYAFYWYFYLDGTIQLEVKLTGVIYTAAVPTQSARAYGTEVAPGVIGQIHQHLFNVRLDMAVDGMRNTWSKSTRSSSRRGRTILEQRLSRRRDAARHGKGGAPKRRCRASAVLEDRQSAQPQRASASQSRTVWLPESAIKPMNAAARRSHGGPAS
jgi:hypothetical protein